MKTPTYNSPESLVVTLPDVIDVAGPWFEFGLVWSNTPVVAAPENSAAPIADAEVPLPGPTIA